MSDRPAPSESLAQNSHPASLDAPAPEYPTGPDLHQSAPGAAPEREGSPASERYLGIDVTRNTHAATISSPVAALNTRV